MPAKILVVDDEAVYLSRLIEQIFEENINLKEYEFIYAQNGKEALEIIHQSPPDLLLTDIRMPQLDGIELLRQLNREKAALKTIVITAYGTIDHIRQVIQERISDFLVKPINQQELKASINRVLLLPSESQRAKVISSSAKNTNRSSSKANYNSVLKLANQLPQVQRSNLVSELITTLSSEQLDELQDDFPQIRLLVQEEEEERAIIAAEDEERIAQGKIPLLLLHDGYIEERFQKVELASGEKTKYRYLYLRWFDSSQKLRGRKLKAEDLEDPKVCAILEKKLASIHKKNQDK